MRDKNAMLYRQNCVQVQGQTDRKQKKNGEAPDATDERRREAGADNERKSHQQKDGKSARWITKNGRVSAGCNLEGVCEVSNLVDTHVNEVEP